MNDSTEAKLARLRGELRRLCGCIPNHPESSGYWAGWLQGALLSLVAALEDGPAPRCEFCGGGGVVNAVAGVGQTAPCPKCQPQPSAKVAGDFCGCCILHHGKCPSTIAFVVQPQPGVFECVVYRGSSDEPWMFLPPEFAGKRVRVEVVPPKRCCPEES